MPCRSGSPHGVFTAESCAAPDLTGACAIASGSERAATAAAAAAAAKVTVIIEPEEPSRIMVSFCLQQVSPANSEPARMVASFGIAR
jgi:hypothetical protein